MPIKRWRLIDQKLGAAATADHWQISAQELEAHASVIKRTWSGGLSDGIVSVEIDNGKLWFNVLPTRGMGIWRAALSTSEGSLPIGWKSPINGPVHPAFVNLGEPSGLGWLDGFDELLVRCGLESNGAPEFDDKTGQLKYPLHGRIANKPASHVELSFDTDKSEIALCGVVEESRFHFQRLRMTTTITTKVGTSSLAIRDEVENLSSRPATMQMLYHINFGQPLLNAGSQVVVPAKTVVPRNAHAAADIKNWDSYAGPKSGFDEQVYFFDLHADELGMTRVLLKNAQATRGVTVLFNKQQLPCFSLWKDTAGEADGYVTGLEPGTNYPNPRSFEAAKGRVVKLGPGEKQAFDVTLEVHGSPHEVRLAGEAITAIQAGRPTEVLDQPRADWCA